ncbi:UNVERIFIED_CONTAM: hypothetical protein GTU68_059079 [Idotea baltica]|nr:hypothetical protein [Idotea baltica]
MMCPYMETEDGLEMQMGVNHFGHFLLTSLLLPLLTKGHQARIVNVSSLAHKMGHIPFEDLKYAKGYSPLQAYSNSKLANILHARHLAKILKGKNVQVFALHPGVVESELGRHLPFPINVIYAKLFSFVAKTTKEGAQTSIHCALEALQQPPFYFRWVWGG